MPRCGSQIMLCDLPIRFDTYEGCSHACSYCFVNRARDISNVKKGESAKALRAFIDGARTQETCWCDWDIPLHWGGVSDPFQPIEREQMRSLECLGVFAETNYPFVVSTKNKLVAAPEYLWFVRHCNCVVQFSAACPSYDSMERGASSFMERMDAASKISPYKRVVIRIQPYIVSYHKEIMDSLRIMSEAGVYGVVVEGIKYFRKVKGTVKHMGDYVYDINLLKPLLLEIKDRCHELGMKFYSGENRLRSIGDSLCCCGIDGLGWTPNVANLNHYVHDSESFQYTSCMKTCHSTCFKSMMQCSIGGVINKQFSFSEIMDAYMQDPKWIKAVQES